MRSVASESGTTCAWRRNLALALSSTGASGKSVGATRSSSSSRAIASVTSRSWTRPSLVRICSSRSSLSARTRKARSAEASSSLPPATRRAVRAFSKLGRSWSTAVYLSVTAIAPARCSYWGAPPSCVRRAPCALMVNVALSERPVQPDEPNAEAQKCPERHTLVRAKPIFTDIPEQGRSQRKKRSHQKNTGEADPPDPGAGGGKQLGIAEPDALAVPYCRVQPAHGEDEQEPCHAADHPGHKKGHSAKHPVHRQSDRDQRQRQKVRQPQFAPIDERQRQQRPTQHAGRPGEPARRQNGRPHGNAGRGQFDRGIEQADPGRAIAAAAGGGHPADERDESGRTQGVSPRRPHRPPPQDPAPPP